MYGLWTLSCNTLPSQNITLRGSYRRVKHGDSTMWRCIALLLPRTILIWKEWRRFKHGDSSMRRKYDDAWGDYQSCKPGWNRTEAYRSSGSFQEIHMMPFISLMPSVCQRNIQYQEVPTKWRRWRRYGLDTLANRIHDHNRDIAHVSACLRSPRPTHGRR